MTLSKLKQEGREEFEKISYHDSGDEYNDCCGFVFNEGKECDCQIKDIEVFLTAQIEKAYLSALSDVEKGLPKEKDFSEEQCPVCGYYCLGKGGFGCIDKPSLIKLSPFSPCSSVKEVINKLKEKHE